MGKALRIFIVLLLLLSITALVFEFMLFSQRQQMKGRTQRLERGLLAVSEQLSAPRDPHIEAFVQRIDVDALKRLDQMDSPIRMVETLVENRRDELFASREELQQTRDTLERTRQDLARTRQELQQTRDQVAQLQRDIERKDQEIAGLRDTVREKDGVIAQHETSIEGLKNEVADLRETEEDLQHQIARLERLIPADQDIGLAERIPAGFKGQVILVEPDWNFVILDVGSEAGLIPNVELLVHRDEELIGRIRVVTVREHIAVADIQRDAQLSDPLEGDSVFFPGG